MQASDHAWLACMMLADTASYTVTDHARWTGMVLTDTVSYTGDRPGLIDRYDVSRYRIIYRC